MAGTFLRTCAVKGSTCRGSGTVSPTCNPAATCVSVAVLPRAFQIAARPAEVRWSADCAAAPKGQISAAHSRRLMALDLLADLTLFARVDLLGIADPATNRFRFIIRLVSRLPLQK